MSWNNIPVPLKELLDKMIKSMQSTETTTLTGKFQTN